MLLSKPSAVIIAGFAMTTSCFIQELLLTDEKTRCLILHPSLQTVSGVLCFE